MQTTSELERQQRVSQHRGERARRLVGVASLVGAVIVIGWVLGHSPAQLDNLRRGFSPGYLLLAVLFHSVALFIAAYNWHRITVAVARDADLARNLRVYVTTQSARRIPGSIWATALRVYWYKKLGTGWRSIGVISALEVWSVSIAGALASAVGALAFLSHGLAAVVWIGLLLVLGLLGTLLLPGVTGRLIHASGRLFRLDSAIAISEVATRELLAWIGISLAVWVVGGLELAVIIRAIVPYQLATIPSIVVAWALAGTAGTLITFVPGGFGVVELALTSLLALVFPMPVAVAASIGMRLLTTGSEVLWTCIGFGGPWLLRHRVK